MPSRALALLIVSMLAAGSPARALDVTGTWKIKGIGAEFFLDVVQSGTSLSIGILTGTIDAAGDFHVVGFNPGCEVAISGRIIGETRLVGSQGGLCPDFFVSATSGIKCECVDGNTTDGDGCDARCQIEPCFTCSGTPSVCVPAGDGASCDDRNACTSGETCSAGVCGGGSPVSPCIDLTGDWLEHRSVPALSIEEDGVVEVRQVGTILEFGGSPTSLPFQFGTIDPSTGAMERGIGVVCGAIASGTGVAAPTGDSYALSAERHDLPACTPYPETVTGARCVGPCVLPTTTSTATSTSSTTTTTSTTVPQLLAGTSLVLRDHTEPARRRLRLRSKDQTSTLGLGNGSADDPTVAGATLRVRTAAGCSGSPCDALFLLPPEHWKAIGKAGQNHGYRYRDKTRSAGPVLRALVKPGRKVAVVAKGASLVPVLDADPSPVDVVLTLGGVRYCFQFGGDISFKPGVRFEARRAVPPDACAP